MITCLVRIVSAMPNRSIISAAYDFNLRVQITDWIRLVEQTKIEWYGDIFESNYGAAAHCECLVAHRLS